jgi:O-antigen/teichoic acid export membrane protein
MDKLHEKTVHALSWSFVETVARMGVQFAIGVIMARLLAPEQFGLIAMLTIFTAVSQSFLDSGFGSAIIQKRDVSQTDFCSVFYFNLAMGLAVVGLLFLAAPWIAAFYRQPALTSLLRVLSLTIVINSFGLVQNAIITKSIDFKTSTKVSMIAGIMSGVIGISMALAGYGVWSLVVQQVASAFFRTASLWVCSSWRPILVFSLTALKGLFSFGSRMLVSSVLNQFFENVYPLVIGRLFSAADLGYFSRAKSLNDLPSQTLSSMVGRVTFPVFSTIQDNPARLKRGLRKALTTLVMVNFPVMIGLAVVAYPLVQVLLTAKWLPSVGYLQLLCVAGLLYPLHLLNLNVLQAMGHSDLFLRLEIVKKIMIVLNIAVTWRWGISALVYGMVINSLLAYYLNSYYTGRLIDYSLREQVKDLLPYLAVSVLAGGAAYAAGLLNSGNAWSALLVQVSCGVLSYVCLSRLFRLRAFMESWQALAARMA